jgi:chemotaxis protein methyltransferase CheR
MAHMRDNKGGLMGDGITLELDEAEIARLLDTLFHRFGYDFRQYSPAHVKRRIMNHMRLAGHTHIDRLQHALMHDAGVAQRLLQDLSITVTEMFRDPDFYRAVREQVVPLLRTWSFIRLWHAGCATGEEVYSMAILLKEEGLYDRVQIYATDMNHQALTQAREGIYPLEVMQRYTRNYQRSGAKGSFSDHCHARYGSAIMDQALKKNIVWADHNLVTDSDFAEVQMVVCRNVLIYFNRDLQHHVHALFLRSLVHGGVLCLGTKETIDLMDHQHQYETLNKQQRIYKRKYHAA